MIQRFLWLIKGKTGDPSSNFFVVVTHQNMLKKVEQIL